MLFLSTSSYAQEQSNDLQLFVNDMLTVADNFAHPVAKGVGYQTSAGWFTSASSLEKWEVEFSVHANSLFISKDDKSFSIANNQDLELLNIEGISQAELPTAFGGATDVYFDGYINAAPFYEGEVRFKAFDGINRKFVPHGFLQFSIGLPGKTELTLRMMPEVALDDLNAGTYGAGIKHNFSQYFGFNQSEDFQLAGGISYSKFNMQYGFAPRKVEDLVIFDIIDVEADMWMLEAIGSKRYGAVEIFGAVGVVNSKFDYEMGGSGNLLLSINNALATLGDSQAQIKADIGFNIYLNWFKISAMATLGELVNANLGLHFRI